MRKLADPIIVGRNFTSRIRPLWRIYLLSTVFEEEPLVWAHAWQLWKTMWRICLLSTVFKEEPLAWAHAWQLWKTMWRIYLLRTVFKEEPLAWAHAWQLWKAMWRIYLLSTVLKRSHQPGRTHGNCEIQCDVSIHQHSELNEIDRWVFSQRRRDQKSSHLREHRLFYSAYLIDERIARCGDQLRCTKWYQCLPLPWEHCIYTVHRLWYGIRSDSVV